jgi:hypothetical protein
VDAFRDRQADVADVNSGLHGAGGISHEGTTGIEADELTCLAAALKWYGGADRAHGYGVPRSDGVVITAGHIPVRTSAEHGVLQGIFVAKDGLPAGNVP